MILENQIIQKLEVIDPYSFEVMVGSLLHQGAFREIVGDNASVEIFGANMEKGRTIKSSPRSDLELASEGLVVENSVRADWKIKLKEDINKNRQKEIKTFVFFTNQDVGTKQIEVDKQNVDAEKHCCSVLNCENSFIFGQKALVPRLQNPRYFNIRRNYLNIPQDFFCSIHGYDNLLENNNSLAPEVDKSKIEGYSTILANELSFDPNKILLLHNDDYVTLLHTIKAWGLRLPIRAHSPNFIDLCFIKWPQHIVNLENVSHAEINDDIRTFIFVWGAHVITNLSEYLMFNKRNAMLVFVFKSGFEQDIAEELHASGTHLLLDELHMPAIDGQKITPDEQKSHKRKIATIAADLINLLLKYEALIYFYSPLYSDDLATKRKMRNILKIKQTQAKQLEDLLLQNDLASMTGKILWLKQPVVAKVLLSDYIDQNIFPIDDLMV